MIEISKINSQKEKVFINLTNGIEALSEFKTSIWIQDYSFIRIQSTLLEQKNWNRIIQDLDYDFLMNLALGNKCIVYDYSAKKRISRAIYQGLPFIFFTLNKRWLGKEVKTIVSRNGLGKYQDCTKYFSEQYKTLDERSKKKLDYFKPYIKDGLNEVLLVGVSKATKHDGDKEYYRTILFED